MCPFLNMNNMLKQISCDLDSHVPNIFSIFFGIPKICFEVGNTNLAADLVDRVKYTHVQGHEFGVLLSYHDYALSSLITNTSTSDPYRVEQKLFRFCSQNILWSDYCELVNLESQSSLPPSLQRRPRSDALLNVYTQVLLFFLILDHVPNFSPFLLQRFATL